MAQIPSIEEQDEFPLLKKEDPLRPTIRLKKKEHFMNQ